MGYERVRFVKGSTSAVEQLSILPPLFALEQSKEPDLGLTGTGWDLGKNALEFTLIEVFLGFFVSDWM